MVKILAKPETLVDELYNIMDMVGKIEYNKQADDIYHYINQLLLAVVVDDE